MTQAAAALSAASPYHVRYMGPVRRVSPALQKAAFWPALLRICDLAGLEFTHWPGKRLMLGPGWFRLVSPARVGPYLALLSAPSRVGRQLWQFCVTLDHLQFDGRQLPVSLKHLGWKLALKAGRSLPLRLVRQQRNSFRRRLYFQVDLAGLSSAERAAEATVQATLQIKVPVTISRGTLALNGKRELRDPKRGVVWRIASQEKVWGGQRIELTASRNDFGLHRVALLGADRKRTPPDLTHGAEGNWSLRFPQTQGRPVELDLQYYSRYLTQRLPLALPGLRFAPAPAPDRSLTGRIKIAQPPEGASRLTVGFRSVDGKHHGTMQTKIDLRQLARSKAVFRKNELQGHLQWRGASLSYALNHLRPGRYRLWVRYRRNLMAVQDVTMPARGAVVRHWTLDCSQVVEFRAQIDRSRLAPQKKPSLLRVFMIPLAPDGTPGLDNYRDAIHGRIEPDGSLILPFLGLGRYKVMALNDVRLDRPYLIREQFTVDRQTRPTWQLRD